MQERMGQEPQDILMNPLIDGLDGTKMSSSRGNYIALTATPSDMFGKVMSMGDSMVETYFNLCTRVPLEEIPGILQLHPKEAKLRLAYEITALYNGVDAAQKAQEEWESTFSKGETPTDVPETSVAFGTKYIDALATLGLSKSELRRLGEQGAIGEVGGDTVKDLQKEIQSTQTLRIGKHRFLKIIVK